MDSILLIIAVTGHIIGMALVLKLSRSARLSLFRNSALNPFVFAALLSFFFGADFLVLYSDPYVPFYEEWLPITKKDVAQAYLAFVAMWFSVVVGAIFAFRGAPVATDVRYGPGRLARVVFLSLLTLACVGTLMASFSGLSAVLRGEISRQVFFREQQVAFVLVSMLPAAFAYFLVGRRIVSVGTVCAGLLVAGLVLLSGSRGGLILLGMIIAIKAAFEGKRLPISALGWMIPVASAALLAHRYFIRSAGYYGGFADFVEKNGGLSGVFFRTTEVSMAEVMTTIVIYGKHVVRTPWESIVASAMYPIPRNLVPIKPLSGDAAFTQEFAPVRWALTKSEIVITGFGDLYLHFGMIVACAALVLLGWLWSRATIRAISDPGRGLVLLPFLLYWLYLFMRSGFYNVAGSVWAWLLVFIAMRFFAGWAKPSGKMRRVARDVHVK